MGTSCSFNNDDDDDNDDDEEDVDDEEEEEAEEKKKKNLERLAFQYDALSAYLITTINSHTKQSTLSLKRHPCNNIGILAIQI